MLSLLLSLTLATLSSTAGQAPIQSPQRPPRTDAADRPANEHRAYVIGAQDSIKIFVFEEPLLSNSYKIAADGTFEYPYIGRVTAVGKTTSELEDEITKKLADGYVRRPQVSIEVET